MTSALTVIGALLAILVPFTVALLLISRWSLRSQDRIYREHAAKMAAQRERMLREFDEVSDRMWWNRDA